jgi:2-polyprenyl-6-methoxyphenol hydroxylase-like FAD-dependent oxidoreductase
MTSGSSAISPNRSVLISGIGIAGPALAYWLALYGFKTTLLEMAPHVRTGGYVIDFWGRGFDVAEKMGLLPAIKDQGYDIKELRLVDANGRSVGGFNVPEVFRSATNGRYVSIARGELAKIIYQKVERSCESIFSDSITEIEQHRDALRVTFKRSRPRDFDLVIGADGLHSVVRKLAFGKQDRFERYLGYMVAAFAVNGYRPRNEDVYVSYGLPNRQVARFAMRKDRTMFLFVFAESQAGRIEAHDTNAYKDILRAEFGHAGWECPKILEAMESCDDIYFDRVSQIRMDTWSNGRIGLIGDAAFCPSLLAGQGAALAMVAAYVLAGELSRATSEPQIAFHRYEQRLRAFITDKQRAAAKFARSFAPKTRIGLFLRNQITKAFRLPFIAELAMGPSLLDRIHLPDYSVSDDVVSSSRKARLI